MEPDRNYHRDELIPTNNAMKVCACARVRVCARESLLCSETCEDVICGGDGVMGVLRLCTSPWEKSQQNRAAHKRLKENMWKRTEKERWRVRKISRENVKRRTACKWYQREIKERKVDQGLLFRPLKIRLSLLSRWFCTHSVEPGAGHPAPPTLDTQQDKRFCQTRLVSCVS